jgi:hypothetical protein
MKEKRREKEGATRDGRFVFNLPGPMELLESTLQKEIQQPINLLKKNQ